MTQRNHKLASIDRGELARVSGGAARVASTGDDTSTQLQLMLSQLQQSLAALGQNNNNSSSSMMMPMMMMMMMGGGGGGGGAAAAAPPPQAPPPPAQPSGTYVRVNLR
ncbi:MAG TPA: hypothetical protein VLX92_12010 [Kofleriaceae bacterium]|nr:hypothetical protein [Kofleriaceae bacterium]